MCLKFQRGKEGEPGFKPQNSQSLKLCLEHYYNRSLGWRANVQDDSVKEDTELALFQEKSPIPEHIARNYAFQTTEG